MAQRGVKAWAATLLVLASACAEPGSAPPPAQRETPGPPAAAPPAAAAPAAPAPAPPAPPPPVAAAPAPRDICGASDLQYLIGRPRTEIPIPLQPGRRRVSCSTCPITQEYVPYRQTIIYDAATGVIREVRCG